MRDIRYQEWTGERDREGESCTRVVIIGVVLYIADLKDSENVTALRYCYGEIPCSLAQREKSENS